MVHLSPVKYRKLAKILKELGFEAIRQKGSHVFFKHSDGRVTTVAKHPRQDIAVGMLRAIIRDIHIEPSQFIKKLQE